MAGPRSPEGKAAKKFADSIDSMSFDANAFAYIFVNDDPALQERAMTIVKALILAWAREYALKGVIEPYAVDAMRLRDTMDTFQMEVPNHG